jgi:hypothetical protein
VQCVLVGVERDDHRDRSEDLFVERGVLGRDAAQHGGFEEQVAAVAAGLQGGAGLPCIGDHARDVVALSGVDQRSERDIAGGRVADCEAARLGNQLCDEGRVDFALYEHAAGRHADLPLMQVDAPRGIGDGKF